MLLSAFTKAFAILAGSISVGVGLCQPPVGQMAPGSPIPKSPDAVVSATASSQRSTSNFPAPVHFFISEWRVLGPLRWQPEWSAGKSAGPVEKALDTSLVPSEAKLIAGEIDKTSDAQWKSVKEPNGTVTLSRIFGTAPFQSAFAVAEVNSPADKDTVLITDADDGIRVWVNGKPAQTKNKAEELKFHYHFAQVHLKQGANRIVAKLVLGARPKHGMMRWRFVVGFTSWDALRHDEAEQTELIGIETPLIASDGKLRLDLRLFGENTKVTADILSANRAPVKTIELDGGHKRTVMLPDLESGLYFCTIHDGSRAELMPFHKGDIAASFREYRRQSNPLLADPTHAVNIGALITRFEHLTKPENRQKEDRVWQAKVAMLFAEWHDILESAAKRRDPYVDVPGTHIRGFRSPVDGQLQHYIVHVPAAYSRSNGPMPLVIVVPFFESPLRPFLESTWPAKIDRNHEFAAFADQSGMAYLMMDNRGNTFGSDFGEADMFAAIRQVMHDYAIDPARFYLFGTCSGGREALALAAKYPDRFAAVGLVATEAMFLPVPPVRPTDPASVLWVKQKTPMFNMANLVNVPVYDIHGELDDHIELKHSLTLQETAAHAKIDFHLDVVPGAGHWRFAVDPLHVIFPWFLQHRVQPNPDHVVLTTTQMRYNRAYWVEIESFADPSREASLQAWYEDGEVKVEARNVRSYVLHADLLRQKTRTLAVTTNGEESFDGPLDGDVRVQLETSPVRAVAGKPPAVKKTAQIGGPLSDVFTGPFLLVVGTSGGVERARASQDFADYFQATWKQRYFVNCPVKKDSEVVDADMEKYHLLLVGDAASNKLLARMSAKLPFHTEAGRVQGPGRSYGGSNISVQYVYPNPLNPRRYIGVLGVPPCLKCPADATQLTLKAWYDYAVWKWDASGKAALIDIGRFDHDWSMTPPPANVASAVKGQ